MLHFAEFAAFIYFCFVLFSHFLLIHFTQKSPHRGTEMGNGKREVGKWEVAWAANCWHLVVAYFVYFLISLLFLFFSFLFVSFDAPCGYRTRDDKFVFAPRFSRIVFCKLLFTVLRMLRDMPQWPGKQTDRQATWDKRQAVIKWL